MTMPKKLEFLTSTRFWSIVLGAVIFYLKVKGFIGHDETVLIETILGGYVTINTVDKAAKKIGGIEE